MRLIDADKLVDALPNVDITKDKPISKVGAIADFICIVAEQPTVDAVPVVRCKDCVKRDTKIKIPVNQGGVEYYCITPCPCAAFNLDDDFFCAKGERKERVSMAKQETKIKASDKFTSDQQDACYEHTFYDCDKCKHTECKYKDATKYDLKPEQT